MGSLNDLDKRFNYRKNRNEGTLIAYFPLGEPKFDALEMAKTYFENGVDVLETGFPVINPFLDGKVISNSMKRILNAGFSADCFFEKLALIKKNIPNVSIEVFSYSQIFQIVEKRTFYSYCTKASVDSILITDSTPALKKELDENLPVNLYNLRFIPFNYTEENIAEGVDKGKGYIFYQAVNGTTGSRKKLNEKLLGNIRELKKEIRTTPLCPGFGISTQSHCREIMTAGADGVVIGSLMVDTVVNHGLGEIGKLIKIMREGLVKG
jgi:tryptophan synthase alpha chain